MKDLKNHILTIIEGLDERDVEGHIWWNKFLEMSEQVGINWIVAKERKPKHDGFFFVKSRYGQTSCFFDVNKDQFNHGWNDEFDNVKWLDNT